MPALSIDELRTGQSGESSKDIRVRVEDARQVQNSRFIGTSSTCNARMQHRQIREHCAIDKDSGNLLQQAMEELSLSARAYDRILKVARTIADLSGEADISLVQRIFWKRFSTAPQSRQKLVLLRSSTPISKLFSKAALKKDPFLYRKKMLLLATNGLQSFHRLLRYL